MQRTVRGDSVADQPGQIKGGTDFCRALSVRGARRLRLGVHVRARSASDRRRIAGAAVGDVQRTVQEDASGLRSAFAHRSRNHWTDGSGAWTVCTSILVLAKQEEHPRKSETV